MDNKYISTLLTIINLMSDDEKVFIKNNITFAGEPFPEAYQRRIQDNAEEWKKVRKEYGDLYGWKWIVNGKKVKKIVNGFEPIPEGWSERAHRPDRKQVIMDNGTIFENVEDAALMLGCSVPLITLACRSNGTKLVHKHQLNYYEGD